MSIEISQVEELLSGIYLERQDGQWKTVVTCLEDIINGGVITFSGLASIAFELIGSDSTDFVEVSRRANKLNNRVGKAGRREVKSLSKVSIQLALNESGNDELVSHASRVGFNRKLTPELNTLVSSSAMKTKLVIHSLKRKVHAFEKLEEPFVYANLINALIKRDDYLKNELWRRDETNAVVLACITGQVDVWDAIQQVLGRHNFTCPYEYELVTTQACLAIIANDGLVDLTTLPALPDEIRCDDIVNLPTLTSVTRLQDGKKMPEYVNDSVLPVADFAQQILLEMLYIRQEAKQ